MRPLSDRQRRLGLALLIYLVGLAVYFAFARPERLTEHTPFNHFALLAESWLEGRLHLGGPPPSYTQMNDFAKVGDNWYVAFPPLPAVWLLPWVWLAGSAEGVRDGQAFLWLAPVAPAVLFLVLEKLSRLGMSERSRLENLALALLFAFGTVYFFSAEQGTVWFAAHVVGCLLLALYVLFALDAERPLLAGLMLGLGFMTRSPLLFAAPLFALEALRVCSAGGAVSASALPVSDLARTAESASPSGGGGPVRRLLAWYRRLDKRRLVKLYAWFALPVAAALAITLWHNQVRFGEPFEFGYRFLTVRWAERMERWGLFHYHYLGRNLGVSLASLPYVTRGGAAPFQINGHGLALWFTTPMYLWLLWPRLSAGARGVHRALWITTLAVAMWTLLYQNTGWVQFGQRFSNDYAVLLFALLAVGGRKLGKGFIAASVFAVVVNAFGAYTFDRPEYRGYYVVKPFEYFQPD